jgi:hypothetical protein
MGQSEGYGQSRDIGNIVHKTQNEDQTNSWLECTYLPTITHYNFKQQTNLYLTLCSDGLTFMFIYIKMFAC